MLLFDLDRSIVEDKWSGIDSHVHIFTLAHALETGWSDARLHKPIFRDFTARDVGLPRGIDKAIFVQVQNDCPEEAKRVLKDNPDWLAGVVVGLQLHRNTPTQLRQQIQELRQYSKEHCGKDLVKGARHILAAESPDWLLQPDVVENMGVLAEEGLVFELLITPVHCDIIVEFVRRCPNNRVVIVTTLRNRT